MIEELTDCKVVGSINSKKYFDKMLDIIDNNDLDIYDKLSQVYKVEEEYFQEFGDF